MVENNQCDWHNLNLPTAPLHHQCQAHKKYAQDVSTRLTDCHFPNAEKLMLSGRSNKNNDSTTLLPG
jgi:hypothetical protein